MHGKKAPSVVVTTGSLCKKRIGYDARSDRGAPIQRGVLFHVPALFGLDRDFCKASRLTPAPSDLPSYTYSII